jgi:hypothetical protein
LVGFANLVFTSCELLNLFTVTRDPMCAEAQALHLAWLRSFRFLKKCFGIRLYGCFAPLATGLYCKRQACHFPHESRLLGRSESTLISLGALAPRAGTVYAVAIGLFWRAAHIEISAALAALGNLEAPFHT